MFAASRYDRGEADYLNCPFNKAEYETFHAALAAAERAPCTILTPVPSRAQSPIRTPTAKGRYRYRVRGLYAH